MGEALNAAERGMVDFVLKSHESRGFVLRHCPGAECSGLIMQHEWSGYSVSLAPHLSYSSGHGRTPAEAWTQAAETLRWEMRKAGNA